LLPIFTRSHLRGGLNLKAFLSSFKDLSSLPKRKKKKKERREKGRSPRQAVKRKRKKGGSLGKEFGQMEKTFDPLTA